MKNKKHVNAFLATTVFASVVPQGLEVNAAEKSKFKDIEDSYAKNEINYLTSKNKLYGMTETTFEPFTETTREQFAVILARLLNLDPKPEGTKFKDVSQWAEGMVGALEDKNIIAGYSSEKFGALEPLTREQMAVFFVRALGYEEEAGKMNLPLKYSDLKDFSDYSKASVAFATEIGILVGFPEGKFYPQKHTLRQDLAAMAYRFWSPESEKNPYKEKADELIAKYLAKLTYDLPSITEENVVKYPIKGKTRPNQEVQITIEHREGEGGSVTKKVNSDENGNFEVEFDISSFPNAELTVTVDTWNGPEKENEKVVKKVEKDLESARTDMEVEKMYPRGKAQVVVDYIKEPYQDEKYYLDGNLIDPIKITFEGDKAILTIPEMEEGKEYTIKIEDKNGNKIHEGKVSLEDLAIAPTELNAIPKALSLQVGEIAVIDYELKNLEGQPAKNAEVRIQVKDEIGIVKEEKVMYSDSEGKIQFRYTSIDVREDTVEAIAVKNPLIRTEPTTTVSWSLAEKGLVTADAKEDIVQGEGTYRTYEASFKDANKNPYPIGSTVYVDLGEEANADTRLKGDFTKIPGQHRYAVATISNYDGLATLRVKDKAGKTIKPLFYYDKDGSPSSHIIDNKDPRYQGGSVKFVKQIPSIVIKDAAPGLIDIGTQKQLDVTALDQFGNPYVGEIKFGVKENLDRLNETNSGNIAIDYQIGENGKSPIIGTAKENQVVADLSLPYENGSEKGNIQVKVKDGNAKDKGHIIFYTDENKNDLDATDYQVEVAVEFEKRLIAAVQITGDKILSKNKYGIYEVVFKDKYGNAAKLKATDAANFVIQIQDQVGNVVASTNDPKHKIDLEANYVKDAEGNYDYAEGTYGPGHIKYQPVGTDEHERFTFSFIGDTAGKYKIVAFIDETVGTTAPNNILADDEASGSIEVEIKAPVISSSKMNVTNNFAHSNETNSFRYQLLDQINETYTTEENLTAEFYLKNDGNKVVKVVTEKGREFTLNPGAEERFEDTILAGRTNYIITATPEGSTGETNVIFKGNIKDKPETVSQADIKWVTYKEDMGTFTGRTEAFTMTGNVIAYRTVWEGTTPKRWYVLENTMGTYLFEYKQTPVADPNHKYTVDGNTDDTGEHFLRTLSENDEIKVTFDPVTGIITHELKNK